MVAMSRNGSRDSIFKKLWRDHGFRRVSSNSTSKFALKESLPSNSDVGITLTQSQSTDTQLRVIETQSQLQLQSQRAGNRAPSQSRGRSTEPQGLNVLYEPPEARTTDIIFVHGLGGSSISTWVKDGDHTTFWPKEFLPLEPSFSTARILSFGYTAFFLSSNASGKMNTMDFARSLLANMKNETELGLGQVPIIFVAHSLGGLVVKKAYVVGRSSDNFKSMISSVSAMMFLGTPHRGSNLAKILNSALAASIIGPSPKQYVADLAEDSPMIDELNEQFKHYWPDLHVASFYETRYTYVGLKKKIIVEKQSAILNCEHEVSQPLDADHHQLCKFGDPEDSKYIIVVKALRSLLPHTQERAIGSDSSQLDSLRTLLSTSRPPDDDLNFYSDRRMPETCSWILSDPIFECWRNSTSPAHTLWINGSAGSGKSILASYLIDHLQTEGIWCNYFFFRAGNGAQQSGSSFLKSLAFQIAQSNPAYKQYLEDLGTTGPSLENSEIKSLWHKLFILASESFQGSGPIYLLVDGLDEAESPQILLTLLTSTLHNLPLRLLIVSRPTSTLSDRFDRFPETMHLLRMSTEGNATDIQRYVEKELKFMRGNDVLRQKVREEVIKKAAGSFLWVHLVAQEITRCHTEGEIEQILCEIPNEMQSLYERMEETMTKSLKPADQNLARMLLSWVACSQRPLHLDELREAIEPKFPHVLDLKSTIAYICDSLLTVDRKSRVLFVHQTGREYLTKLGTGGFAIDLAEAHSESFQRCMAILSDTKLRTKLVRADVPKLASYASRAWPYHLNLRFASSDRDSTAIRTFLQGSYVLTWIQMLAMQDELSVMIQAARSLSEFVARKAALDSSSAPDLGPLQAIDIAELWAVDLVKIVGKFGRNLLEAPDSIFKFIPQFCPRQSIINRQFGRKSAFSVDFPGDSNDTWDDSLAKLFVGANSQALNLVCARQCFAILNSSEEISLWDSATCQKVGALHHGEHVTAICASNSGKLIASYGFLTTKVWNVATKTEQISISNPRAKALGIMFSTDDSEVLAGSDDRVIRNFSLKNAYAGWQQTGPDLFSAEATLAGTILNSPCSIAFSPDGTQVAMAFRGAPLSVWGVLEPYLVARCRRNRKDKGRSNARPWTVVNNVLWHPRSGDILGIYEDGTVFKWQPQDDSSQDLHFPAHRMTCSSDGDLFATSDSHTVNIWKFYEFVLVYQVRWDYPVANLTFSPDNRRLYVLGGSFCHVWEPHDLIRLADQDSDECDAKSESGITLLSTAVPEAEIGTVEPISALSVRPQGDMYCAGNAEGIVTLVQLEDRRSTEIWKFRSHMPIEHITWDLDGLHVAFRDLYGEVVVKKLETTEDQITSSPQFNGATVNATLKPEDGPFEQLLLSSHGDFLLFSTAICAQVWSTQNGSCTAMWRAESYVDTFKWVNHPGNPDLLLRVGASNAFVCIWNDLVEESKIAFNVPNSHKPSRSSNRLDRIRKPFLPRSQSLGDSGAVIENLMLTQDGAHIMIETSRSHEQDDSERQLMIFTKAQFEGKCEMMSPRPMPTHLFDKLQLPLGILPGDNFVFLDNDHWLCSWNFDSIGGSSGIERHYFLPRDWLNAECLELCRLVKSGVLLIPKNGDVASVRSRLSLQW